MRLTIPHLQQDVYKQTAMSWPKSCVDINSTGCTKSSVIEAFMTRWLDFLFWFFFLHTACNSFSHAVSSTVSPSLSLCIYLFLHHYSLGGKSEPGFYFIST